MKIIGVTGGVGAGKSAILSYLEQAYGAKVILADVVANQLKEPGRACYEPIVALLGDDILQSDGQIDRKQMGKKIFSDSSLLKQVNEIIHPAVKQEIITQINENREMGTAILVIEAALLLEENYDAICDEVWYIYTSEEIRRFRLKENRGYSDEYITDIVNKQLPDEVFRARCDFVVNNSGTIEESKKQIDDHMK